MELTSSHFLPTGQARNRWAVASGKWFAKYGVPDAVRRTTYAAHAVSWQGQNDRVLHLILSCLSRSTACKA